MRVFKKIFILMIAVATVFMVTACDKNLEVTMIVPSGSPQLTQLYMQNDDNYKVDIVYGPDPLVAAFGSQTYDVIFAPTNLGAKFYNQSQNYQLIASVVWGNYYLISETAFALDDLSNSDITAFGKNQTPDIILSYVLSENDITANIKYDDNDVATVASKFALNPSGIYLVAEPVLSQLVSTHDHLTILDLQEEYAKITGEDSYPQASVFAKSTLSDDMVDQIKNDLKKSISKVTSGDDVVAVAESLDVSISSEILVEAISRSHLEFVDAADAKSAVESYLNILLSVNVNLVGQLPDESFYR